MRKRKPKPNFLLIAGNGRNVGKTHLSCQVISHLAKSNKVIAIKISSHFHSIEENKVIVQNDNFIIIEESQVSQKDSWRMKQAGAQKVYFIMAAEENLEQAFSYLEKLLPEEAIVCESGGLHELINPGAFLYVNKVGQELVKQNHLKFNPELIMNDGKNFDFDIARLEFKNNRFSILRRAIGQK